MTPDQVPQNLIDILDEAANKLHSREGSVVATLVAILTEYDRIKNRPIRERCDNCRQAIVGYGTPTGEVLWRHLHVEGCYYPQPKPLDQRGCTCEIAHFWCRAVTCKCPRHDKDHS